MPFVVDASLVAAWLLPDEKNPQTDALLLRLQTDRPIAPDLLWHEVRSLIVNAVRRGRVSREFLRWAAFQLDLLPILPASSGNSTVIIALADKYQLSAYDAAYLALAGAERMPLATLDRKLATAARAENISILGPLAS